MPDPFPGLQRWPYPAGQSWWYGGTARRRGRWLMVGDTRRATAFVDLDAWPPNTVAHPDEYVVSFDLLPDGRVVVCSMPTNPAGEYAVRSHPAGWLADPAVGPPLVIPPPPGTTTVEVWAVTGRVVVFDGLIERPGRAAARRAHLLDPDAGGFAPAPGLPPVREFLPGQLAHQVHSNGKAVTADGAEVLVWDGAGYEWAGRRFVRRWPLTARGEHLGRWTALPWGPDGFLYHSEGRVLYARRGREPVPVHPDADSVAHLGPGPDDSVILCLHRSPDRHVARVWFPAEGSYIPVVRKHLGAVPHWMIDPLYWSPVTRHVSFHYGALMTFPEADLLGLKRVRPKGDGYRVPKG